MRSDEYVERYKLRKTFRFDRSQFTIDFMLDFDRTIGDIDIVTYDRFQSLVAEARSKWDNIFSGTKVSTEHADRFWGFIFATEIVPRRDRAAPRRQGPVSEDALA